MRTTSARGVLSTLLVASVALHGGEAFAGGTFSGIGTPTYGGTFAGSGERGALGVAYNPAAAFSVTPEVLVDVGLLGSNYSATLEGEPEFKMRSVDPVPFIAATTPLSNRLGLGFNIGAPYARSGGGEPEPSQRFHSMGGGILVVQADTTLSLRVTGGLAVGAGLTTAHVSASSLKAIDTGEILYSLLGDESLIGEPVLEGRTELLGAKSVGFGFTVGALYEHESGASASLSWRSPVDTYIRGKMVMTPSTSFNLQLEGDLTGQIRLPTEVHGALTVPAGPISLRGEFVWVSWSAIAETHATVEDMVVVSDDPILRELLASYGLSDPETLGDTQSVGFSGMENVLALGGRVLWEGDGVSAQVGGIYSPSATPSSWVTPANIDFESIEVNLGGMKEIGNGLHVGGSLASIVIPDRVVTDSTASWTTPPEIGPVAPSGNGTYKLSLWRVGTSLLYKF